ncbi:hypothetical protein DV737_g5521, partial [Chaetothyriales sp. CBS 132003]
MTASSLSMTTYLILTQVSSRALTFLGNQILLRFLSPTLLGMAVQLELLSVTVLYSARESLRVALQRRPKASNHADAEKDESSATNRGQSTVNLAYLVIAVGLLLGLISGVSYFLKANAKVLLNPDFNTAFAIYSVATVIELFAEPSFLIIQQDAMSAARAKAETVAAIARCLSSCGTAVVLRYTGQVSSVLPFAIGQLAYASVLFSMYYAAAQAVSRHQHFRLLPVPIGGPEYLLTLFNKPIVYLASTMYVQSIFKLLLTEGDAFILSAFSSLADQGSFHLAANYGGLLARLIFQPLEEGSRNIFGRTLSATTVPSASTTNIQTALSHLSSLVHFYLLAACPLVTLAPRLVPLLSSFLFSSAFRTPGITSLLSTYIYYIPFMAVNGILDAFVTCIATSAQFRLQSVFMALFTVLYALVAWALLQKLELGAPGLVWANIFNMTMRIAWSCWFITSWIKQQYGDMGKKKAKAFWSECLPHPSVLLAAVAVSGIRLAGTGQPNHFVNTVTSNTTQATNPTAADRDLDVRKLIDLVAQVALFAVTM